MARTPKPGGLERENSKRDARESILIVCEGAKTEPFYFSWLKHIWKIHMVEVEGESCGSAPICVVDKAKGLRQEREIEAKTSDFVVQYDQVWCVFDRDQHVSFNDARKKAKDNKIYVALSKPCFEFWYLLHFVKTTRGFTNCDDLIRYLKKNYIADYKKNDPPMRELLSRLGAAYENAEYVKCHGGGDPCTDVDKLVKILEGMKR